MRSHLLPALALALGLALGGAGQGAAAVIYTFDAGGVDPDTGRDVAARFVNFSPDFITATRFVTPAEFDTCTISRPDLACQGGLFEPTSAGAYVNVEFSRPSELVGFGVFFDPTAFSTLGLHEDAGHFARLTVSLAEAKSGTPEPASWALMIGGLGAAGAMLRRRAFAAAGGGAQPFARRRV